MSNLRLLTLIACLGSPLASQEPSIALHNRAVVISIGPVDIPAHRPYDQPVAVPPVQLTWPASGWARGYSIDLVDSAGRVLPRTLLHHAAVANLDRRQLLNAMAERLMAAGKETDEVSLPGGLGVPLTIGDRLLVYYALANPGAEDIRGAALRLTIPWQPAGSNTETRSAFPVEIDALPLVGRSSTFDVPPGPFTIASEFTVPTSGRIRSAGAHLHDYGVEVRLEDVESGEVLVRLPARRDPDGRVLSVARTGLRVLAFGVQLKTGRRYRVVGDYFNPTCTTVSGAMAGIGAVFEPDDARAWPQVDREDPVYRRDLSWLTIPDAGHGTHHADASLGARSAACVSAAPSDARR